jgi:hypothetical protein
LLLGGWQVSGIGTYQTGLPFTPTVSAFDPAGLGLIPVPLVAGRPNITCNPNEGGAHTAQQWFNPSCFQITPTTGSVANNNVGNGGRGIVEGPGTKRVDLTLSKNFKWGESYRLQLRAEAFNVFNWTSFRGLSTASGTQVRLLQHLGERAQPVVQHSERLLPYGIHVYCSSPRSSTSRFVASLLFARVSKKDAGIFLC